MLVKRAFIALLIILWAMPAFGALNDNLDLVLDFETGTIGEDTSGSSLTFTENGTIPTTTGKIGSVALDGPDCTNYLELAHASSGALSVSTGSFSVSYWINTGAFVGSGHMVLVKRNGSGNGWWTNIVGDGTAGLAIDEGANDTVTSGGATNIENSGWHHIISVSDQSVPEIRHYVDGALDGQTGVSIRDVSNTEVVRVGCHAGGNNPLDQVVDQIAFWSRALSLAEAQSIYNSGTGITLPTESTPTFIPGRSIIIIGLEWITDRFFS